MASRDMEILWVTGRSGGTTKLQLRLSPREKLMAFNQESQDKWAFKEREARNWRPVEDIKERGVAGEGLLCTFHI